MGKNDLSTANRQRPRPVTSPLPSPSQHFCVRRFLPCLGANQTPLEGCIVPNEANLLKGRNYSKPGVT